MVNFLIVTHGEFGAYLVEAAEGIVGRQAHGVRVIGISSRLSVPEIRERVQKGVKDLANPQGLIVFTDMPGGTPTNLALPVVKDAAAVEMISGVNLYMLVSAFNHRDDMPLPKLVEKILADGQKSIRDIRHMLAAGSRK